MYTARSMYSVGRYTLDDKRAEVQPAEVSQQQHMEVDQRQNIGAIIFPSTGYHMVGPMLNK